jgi:hypothetical protein
VFAAVGLATDPAAAHAAGIDEPAMDRAERWCGECREHERVRRHSWRDPTLPVARQSGCDEEVGVTTIAFRAGRTPRLASVATGNEDEARSSGSRRAPSEDCTSPSRQRHRLTLQADRRGTAAGPADQLDDGRCTGAVAVSEHRQRSGFGE